MEIKKISESNGRITYHFTVDTPDVDKLFNEKIDALAQKGNMKGFRPGKIPHDVIIAHYGKDLSTDVRNQFINEFFRTLDKEKIRPLGDPTITGECKIKTPFKGVVEFDVYPEIKNTDFSTYNLIKWIHPVDEADTEEALHNISAKMATYTPILENRPTKQGDTIVFDFKGTVDGKPFDGGDATDYRLKIGSHTLIPGFEEQLTGKSVKETFEVKVTFPANYGNRLLSGKSAIFHCTLKNIEKENIPELNDELAKKAGATDVNNLKEQVQRALKIDYDAMAYAILTSELMNKIAQEYQMLEIPAHTLNQQLQQSSDPSAKDKLLRQLRISLVVAHYGQEWNIQVSENDLKAALMEEMSKWPGQEQQVLDYYKKDPQATNQLKMAVFDQKAVKAIVDKCSVKEESIPLDQLKEKYRQVT